MECNNRVFTVLLIAIAAVAGGLGIVFSLGVAVQSAAMPLSRDMREIIEGQKKIEAVLSRAPRGDLAAIEARLAALESQVQDLRSQPRNPGNQAQQPQMPPSEDMNRVYDLPAGDSAVLGPGEAPVTITIFTDYQCPFCSRFYPAAVEGQKAFSDKVRIVIKHFPLPFHDKAIPAAKAVLAAGEQGKFYEMSDLVFASAAALSDDKFRELAGKAGLNVEKFLKDLKDNDAVYAKKIDADMELGGKADVHGTPTYFLNGKKSNARTADAWKSAIAEILKK
jgi:protein-disulfide isomerase